MPKAVSGDTSGGEAFGDGWGGVVEKDDDLVIVAELTGCSEGAEVDPVQVVQVMEVEDQPQWADPSKDSHEGLA